MPVNFMSKIFPFRESLISHTRSSTSVIPVVEIMSLNQETSISSKILLTENRWADFQKAFDADAVDPQNSQSDLGLFGQFNRLMKVTNKSFGFKLAIGGWTYITYFSNAVR